MLALHVSKTYPIVKLNHLFVLSVGEASVTLESPVIGHESPDDLIMNARRKCFPLPMRNDIVPSARGESCPADDLAVNVFSVTSVTGGSDSSDASRSPGMGRTLSKRVSFLPPNPLVKPPPTILPQLGLPNIDLSLQDSAQSAQPLLRAKLSSKNTQDHILVLSFPRIVCDHWSSCLFVYQLCDAYSKLEKSSAYRPSLAATRIEDKRQVVIKSHQRIRGVTNTKKDSTSRLLQKRAQGPQLSFKGAYVPPFPSRLSFQQVAQRESQLLLMLSREKLWTFWESMVTAVIRRQRGPNRVKVVPPIRIPSGLGEKVTKTRPQTSSRLRPLTASRNRPATAKRGSGFHGDLSRETMMGPKTKFHCFKVLPQSVYNILQTQNK